MATLLLKNMVIGNCDSTSKVREKESKRKKRRTTKDAAVMHEIQIGVEWIFSFSTVVMGQFEVLNCDHLFSLGMVYLAKDHCFCTSGYSVHTAYCGLTLAILLLWYK